MGIRVVVASVICATSCFAQDDVYSNVDAVTNDLENRMLLRLIDPRRAESDIMLFTYSGPAAWSKPQARIEVSNSAGHDNIEYIEMAEHVEYEARVMHDEGILDTAQALRHSALHYITANETTCPKILDFTNEISALAIAAINDDSKSENQRIMTDGGYSYNYYFGTKNLSSFSYTDYFGGNKLSEKIAELKKYLVACGKETAIKTDHAGK